jgi:DNA-directed RNA polymerase I subunit RPA43
VEKKFLETPRNADHQAIQAHSTDLDDDSVKMPAAASPEPATPKHEKKHKKVKSAKSEKKRAREDDATAVEGERKHKRSKSVTADVLEQSHQTPGSQDVSPEKRKKKDKHGKDAGNEVEPASEARADKTKSKKHRRNEAQESQQDDEAANPSDAETKSAKKDKKKKKKHAQEAAGGAVEESLKSEDPDSMDIDKPAISTLSSAKVYQPTDIPANPQFPFFSQTVSLYEPIYPSGWAQPVTNCQYQHLQHLQNKYVPSLRGVLLDYKNVTLGPEPGRDGAAADDETATTLVSRNEYAVGFGWITADVELFVPGRGAWMEGSVNLQTEGHLGVVCFGKFNASIEARRLPPSWKWVSNESPEANGFEETASVITADDHGVVRQIHSTGFWVDGDGERVKGKIRFRIRNFDAGTSGETSYLSLEGTMLDKDSEKKLIKEEARTAQMRMAKKSGRKIERRRAPDFAMTRFVDAQAEGEEQKQEGGSEDKQES